MHSPRDSTDRCTELLTRAQKGDTQAFAELYTTLRPAVRGFVASLDGHLSAQDHEDIAQEVFLRTWRGSGSFRGEASAKTFILAIARQVVLNEPRRRRNVRDMPTSDMEKVAESRMPGPSDGLVVSSLKELTEQVEQAIAGLTDKQRQAVELDQFTDLSRRETARLARCSPEQFADRLYRARKRLRQVLKKWFHFALL